MKTSATNRKITPAQTRRIITLDDSQLAQYHAGDIELHAPNGEVLEILGDSINAAEAELSEYRVKYQLALVEDLLRNAKYPLELSEQGGIGLVETLGQAQEFLQ